MTVFSSSKANLRMLTEQELADLVQECQRVIRQQRADFEEYELLHTAQHEIERRKRQTRSMKQRVLHPAPMELQVA